MPADHEPSLTFFNGTRTVGGVQVLARAGRSALCFDFGATPNPSASLFSRACPPPQTGSLPAHLRAGMAPMIEGLYDPTQLAAAGASVAQVCEPMRREGRLLQGMPLIDDIEHLGVFISHIHNDHCGLVPFVAPEVPVIMSAASAALHAGMVDSHELPPSPARILGLSDGMHTRIGELTWNFLMSTTTCRERRGLSSRWVTGGWPGRAIGEPTAMRPSAWPGSPSARPVSIFW